MITSSILTLFSRGQNKKFDDITWNARVGGRGQFFEAEAKTEDNIFALRPACPGGLNISAIFSIR